MLLRLPKKLFQDWGISLNELDRLAVVNMEREFPPVLLDFIEVDGNGGSLASEPKIFCKITLGGGSTKNLFLY